MKKKDTEIFELHADFCKTIASSKRLMIIELLAEREMSVSEIVEALDVRLSNISQHLRVLRSRNIVKSRKEGQTVYYSLTNSRIPEICNEIRSILLEGMEKRGEKAKGMIKGGKK
jgi:ArsR family transcriptional regulator